LDDVVPPDDPEKTKTIAFPKTPKQCHPAAGKSMKSERRKESVPNNTKPPFVESGAGEPPLRFTVRLHSNSLSQRTKVEILFLSQFPDSFAGVH
jgi:hypothetical protein